MSISLNKLFKIGCGDNSCRWGSPGGMATNGGCACYDRGSKPTDIKKRMELMDGIRILRDIAELPNVLTALREFGRLMRRPDPKEEDFQSWKHESGLEAITRWVIESKVACEKDGKLFDTLLKCVSEGGKVFYVDPEEIERIMMDR